MTFNFSDFGPMGLINFFRGTDREDYGYENAEPRRHFALIQRWRRDEDGHIIGEWSKED